MQKTYLLAIMFVLSSLNTEAQADKGWVSLFDGQSLQGWHLFKKPGSQSAWRVQDGAIYLDVSNKEGRGDLVTDQAFGDFHLKLEWKVKKGSNSGVIFFVQEQDRFGATWHTGPEFQVIDNTGYPDKLEPMQMAGSLYDLVACPTEYIKPTGEWNASEIIFQKGKLEFILNGHKAVSIMVGSDAWKTLIANSKFRTMKDFAQSLQGKIALQDHGGEVWYRNILIKSL
ncbi:MAG: DUF1080 domain-containing protein [Chitinophagaceae bacterium]|jgi:hypothetical protein|nr:DUF1080 domain-containing protein [Chitinophagaceae bacterium]